MKENVLSMPTLPHCPGIYLMRDQTGRIIYIGKALSLKKRVASYFNKRTQTLPVQAFKLQALVEDIRHIDYIPTASERDALVLERRLIRRFQPNFNVMWKDDKSYPFVALTMGEDFPRVFLTRKRKRDGTLYFGPYPSVKRVRRLLHWAWKRKLFPLRLCKLDIKEGQPYSYEKVKSCLYLHTKECPAPCLARISAEKYKKIALKAKWFLEGNKEKLAKEWEKDMARYSKKMDYEKAAELRDRMDALRHMDERITVRQMSEEMLNMRTQKTQAVQVLRGQLNLKNPPEIMECFDISHIQGVEKVASMVRFEHGRPAKSEYRKYIIRTVTGIDDFRSIAEVVERRTRRLRKEGKPLPDLIVIDGGKGQLSSALEALRGQDIKDIPIIALAKKEEEIYFPNNPHPLRLPIDSPALLLLRQIRDEAHRFAIQFHRHRRKKRIIDINHAK